MPKSSNLNAKKIYLTDKPANLAGKSYIYIIQIKNCWNSIQIRHHVLGVTFQAFKLARGSRIPNMFIQIGVEVKRVFVVCVLISHYPQFYPHQCKWHAYYVIVVCPTPGGGGGQLPLKGGHHARTWTFKMDPKQVIILRFSPP